MDIFKSFEISASGLVAQRLRMNVISSNLANIDSTRTPQGGPYRRKDVVFAAAPASSSFHSLLGAELDGKLSMVKVLDVVEGNRPYRRIYDPGHPDASAGGYVLLPNINPMEEMVNLLSATRSYEANVTAINAAKSMARSALNIGKV